MTREEFLQRLPELLKNYQPAADVLSRIKNVELLMVVGPSGVGKTTLINKLNFKYVPSDTSRHPRPGEKEGIDFYFRTSYDELTDDIKKGRFVQVVIGSGGDFYSTKDTSFPVSGVAAMPVMAYALPEFRQLGFKRTISAFITPQSFEEWMRWMNTHPLTDEERQKRLAEAERSLKVALSDDQMHFILNDEIDRAVRRLEQVVAGQSPDDEEQARKVAQDNYQKLITTARL